MCSAEAAIWNTGMVSKRKTDEETRDALVRVPEIHDQRTVEEGDQ